MNVSSGLHEAAALSVKTCNFRLNIKLNVNSKVLSLMLNIIFFLKNVQNRFYEQTDIERGFEKTH